MAYRLVCAAPKIVSARGGGGTSRSGRCWSVLVGGDGTVLAEDHNRVAGGDRTRHPEFEPARWSAARLTPEERAAATVHTSGEHCPMCAAAHAWVGLGRIVYVASSAQLVARLEEWGAAAPPVRPLPVHEVAPDVRGEGPVPEPADEVRALHRRFHADRAGLPTPDRHWARRRLPYGGWARRHDPVPWLSPANPPGPPPAAPSRAVGAGAAGPRVAGACGSGRRRFRRLGPLRSGRFGQPCVPGRKRR